MKIRKKESLKLSFLYCFNIFIILIYVYQTKNTQRHKPDRIDRSGRSLQTKSYIPTWRFSLLASQFEILLYWEKWSTLVEVLVSCDTRILGKAHGIYYYALLQQFM